MIYRIDFLDDDNNPQHGYLGAVSSYWATLQFNEGYDFEITDVTEWYGEIDDEAIPLE